MFWMNLPFVIIRVSLSAPKGCQTVDAAQLPLDTQHERALTNLLRCLSL